MKEISIKGVSQVYLQPNETVPHEIEIGGNVWRVESPPAIMQSIVASANDIRAIIVRGLPQLGRAYVHYLYWYRGANLEELDKGILASGDVDTYFQDVVITRYQRTICTDGCRERWHSLVIPHSGAFIANPPQLNLANLEEIPILSCPSCGTKIRQLVVKIFGKAE